MDVNITVAWGDNYGDHARAMGKSLPGTIQPVALWNCLRKTDWVKMIRKLCRSLCYSQLRLVSVARRKNGQVILVLNDDANSKTP